MKQPSRLTRNAKECLMAHKLNPHEWMLVQETEFCYCIINKESKAIKRVDKFRK